MIIVAGIMNVAPQDRQAFLDEKRDRIESSRSEPGCIDYIYSADSVDPGRVRLFEMWESEDALKVHLLTPPPQGTVPMIDRTITVYEIASQHPL